MLAPPKAYTDPANDTTPNQSLAGLLEVRGLGIVRLPHVEPVRLVLVAQLGVLDQRVPEPARHPVLDLPLVRLEAGAASAAARVALALDCALGRVTQCAGTFAA